jgi:hypothetical protein
VKDDHRMVGVDGLPPPQVGLVDACGELTDGVRNIGGDRRLSRKAIVQQLDFAGRRFRLGEISDGVENGAHLGSPPLVVPMS